MLLLALSSVTEVKNTAKVTKCLPRCLPAPPPHAAGVAGAACVLPKPTTWPAPRRGAVQALAAARRTKVAYSRKPLLSVEYRSDRVA